MKSLHDRVLNRLALAIEARGLDKTAFLKAATGQEPQSEEPTKSPKDLKHSNDGPIRPPIFRGSTFSGWKSIERRKTDNEYDR